MPPTPALRAYHLQQPHDHINVMVFVRGPANGDIQARTISGLPTHGTLEYLANDNRNASGSSDRQRMEMRADDLQGFLATFPDPDTPLMEVAGNTLQPGTLAEAWGNGTFLPMRAHLDRSDWPGRFTRIHHGGNFTGTCGWCSVGYPAPPPPSHTRSPAPVPPPTSAPTPTLPETTSTPPSSLTSRP